MRAKTRTELSERQFEDENCDALTKSRGRSNPVDTILLQRPPARRVKGRQSCGRNRSNIINERQNHDFLRHRTLGKGIQPQSNVTQRRIRRHGHCLSFVTLTVARTRTARPWDGVLQMNPARLATRHARLLLNSHIHGKQATTKWLGKQPPHRYNYQFFYHERAY